MAEIFHGIDNMLGGLVESNSFEFHVFGAYFIRQPELLHRFEISATIPNIKWCLYSNHISYSNIDDFLNFPRGYNLESNGRSVRFKLNDTTVENVDIIMRFAHNWNRVCLFLLSHKNRWRNFRSFSLLIEKKSCLKMHYNNFLFHLFL